ncbi:inositol monophosphatase family protein [Bacteroides sp.]
MYKEFLDFTLNMVKGVAEIQLSYFRGNNLGIQTKSNIFDVVTRADKESEEYIAHAIFERYPDHKLLGEEGGFRGNEHSDYLWVVDPLDGTTNFSQGLPLFCISVALQYKGETIVGVVYAPYINELFTAVKGEGAYMNYGSGISQRIHVSQKQSLNPSVIATGFPYDKDINPDNNSGNLAKIIPHVRDIRRQGTAAYDICCVAAGMLDGYWELSLNLWDVCAANLILQEAGGVIDYFRENRGVSEIAGNETIVNEIKKYIK